MVVHPHHEPHQDHLWHCLVPCLLYHWCLAVVEHWELLIQRAPQSWLLLVLVLQMHPGCGLAVVRVGAGTLLMAHL